MKEADKRALNALSGRKDRTFGVEDLQGMLLQVSLAIMMIFMIAFFMFRLKSEKEQQEQVMELVRQKLTLACDRVAVDYRTRYGLPVYTTLSSDGKTVFKASTVVAGSGITADPTIATAFKGGVSAAAKDYADAKALCAEWVLRVVKAAGVAPDEIDEPTSVWLVGLVERRIAGVRKEMTDVERACAAAIQREWLANPSGMDDDHLKSLVAKLKGADEATRLMLASEISEALRAGSLERLEKLVGAEVLK